VSAGVVAAGAGFAAATGANDGGALIGSAVRMRVLTLPWLAGLLVASVALVPRFFGTAVATTLAGDLVGFGGPAGGRRGAALVAALVAAVAVVAACVRLRAPTSLALAFLGGLAGAGLGAGLPVAWGEFGLVLVVAAVAPVVGAALAFVVTWSLVAVPRVSRRLLRTTGVIAYVAMCLAYGANGGQKAVAVLAIATDRPLSPVPADGALLVATALLFALGLVVGLPWSGGTLAGDIAPARSFESTAAIVVAGGVVLVASAAGAPVSLTQVVGGSLTGSRLPAGWTRVRWRVAARIVVAWVVTLPAALVVGALLGAVARGAGA